MNYQRAITTLGKGNAPRGKKLIFEIAELVEKHDKMTEQVFLDACQFAYRNMLNKMIEEVGE